MFEIPRYRYRNSGSRPVLKVSLDNHIIRCKERLTSHYLRTTVFIEFGISDSYSEHKFGLFVCGWPFALCLVQVAFALSATYCFLVCHFQLSVAFQLIALSPVSTTRVDGQS